MSGKVRDYANSLRDYGYQIIIERWRIRIHSPDLQRDVYTRELDHDGVDVDWDMVNEACRSFYTSLVWQYNDTSRG